MLRSLRNPTMVDFKGQPIPGGSPLRARGKTEGPRKRKKRCTAEEMRYQRYKFKEWVSALVIRNVT